MFSSLALLFFWFSTCPRDTGFRFNLLYLDLSFSEIGVRSAVHLVPFCYLCILALQVFILGFGLKAWSCTLSWTPNEDVLSIPSVRDSFSIFFWTRFLTFFLRGKRHLIIPKVSQASRDSFLFFWTYVVGYRLRLKGFHFAKITWLNFTPCQVIKFLFFSFFFMVWEHYQHVTCQPIGFHFGQNMLAL